MGNTFQYRLFLLGGYDLEMLTIKHMLEGRNDCVVLDEHLSWKDAKLSAYKNYIQRYSGYDIYGIELLEDIPLPCRYVRIDHHNDWNYKSSSLEQVAAILGVTLDRYHLLVAANDKGYIPAMQTLSATREEIDDIRRKDRTAQGVREEDESLAEFSIANNMVKYPNLIVVKSLTSYFSPICDRLFPFSRLLIYTNAEWMFYGDGKSDLVKLFNNEVECGKLFHGGGEKGYVGSFEFAYSINDIKKIVELIKDIYECN